jgi:hypothetical protein
LANIQFTTRIMPLQILGRRATNTVYKYRALLRSLTLEVGNAELIKARTFSVLHDMGVESKLPMVPDFDGVTNQRAFRHALPLHDLDHGLHIVMKELDECWSGDLYKVFNRQLNGLAKYFSKADNLDRFKKFCIFENPSLKGAARKKSIAQMFDRACPTLVKHRWEYLHEVLSWVIPRHEFLAYLHRDPHAAQAERDAEGENGRDDAMSELEADAFKLMYSDEVAAATFCAMCAVLRVLCSWGHDVVGWLHGCWCHPTEAERKAYKKEHGRHCPWSGRRMIELSHGQAHDWIAQLQQSTIERDTFASQALQKLTAAVAGSVSAQAKSIVDSVASGFVTARRMLHARFVQLMSFLVEPPWSFVSMLQFLIVPPGDMPEAVVVSRQRVSTLLSNYDKGKLAHVGDIGLRFLQTTHRAALRRWASGQDVFMDLALFRSLLGYATSLNVMQRLEAKHHLVQARLVWFCVWRGLVWFASLLACLVVWFCWFVWLVFCLSVLFTYFYHSRLYTCMPVVCVFVRSVACSHARLLACCVFSC